jgi:hypothetical protein
MREGGRAGGGPLSRGDVAFQLAKPALCKSRPEQLKAAGDPRKQIIEIVRKPSGELAYRFHFLRLEELFL